MRGWSFYCNAAFKTRIKTLMPQQDIKNLRGHIDPDHNNATSIHCPALTPVIQWLTTAEIPTALTKFRLPMVLALLTALRFLLISFFGGRWCSFAQMGFSLERLTRPRNTIVTNLFIIALPLLQAWDLIVMPSRADLWNRQRCVCLKSAAEETWEEKSTRCMCNSGREGEREGGERES